MAVSPHLHARVANMCKWVYTEARRCAGAAVKIPKNLLWCWPWCVPSQEPFQSKMHQVLHNSWYLQVMICGVCLTEASWTRQKLEPVHSVFPS